jgi:hypothetical protein
MPDWKHEIRRRLAGVKLEPTREAAVNDADADRHGDRIGRRVGVDPLAEDAVVRRERGRSADICRDRSVARARFLGRLLDTGAAGDEG